MNKDSIIDYSSCILIKLLGPLMRALPKNFALFLGRRLGDLFYYFDFKHKAAAYSNIKTAFGHEFSPSRIRRITRDFYRNFGQNLIEIFLIPLIDKEYINKYITLEGLDHIYEAFKKGKGLILVGMHEGSWELSNIISANLGFPFVLFVRSQRHPRLNELLNNYRIQKGCKIIKRQGRIDAGGASLTDTRQNELFSARRLIDALKRNEAIGMMVDQGGRTGRLIKFLGKEASMPSGAVRFALKYDAVIIPAFYARLKGLYHKVLLGKPLETVKTGDLEKDIDTNLQKVVEFFEKQIKSYPGEYLWTYKIWKYGLERNILILSDGKTGHLRQAEAAAKNISACLKDKGFKPSLTTIVVKYRDKLSGYAQAFSGCLAGKYTCQGCAWCLRSFLNKDVYNSLVRKPADFVVSCGSSLAAVNYIISRNNRAKSIVIMKPSFLSMKRFDLVILPRHDNPPARKNVAVTQGALNLVDEAYLKEQAEKLMAAAAASALGVPRMRFGLLIGGDTKDFCLNKGIASAVIRQIKDSAQKYNAAILATTSRRTSSEIENLVSEELENYAGCELSVIANRKNLPFAVGGILGLSKVVIVSPESISMISEAASSGRYVIVFKSQVNPRHRAFLSYLSERKYIYLTEPGEIAGVIDKILTQQPKINTLNDNLAVRSALEKIM